MGGWWNYFKQNESVKGHVGERYNVITDALGLGADADAVEWGALSPLPLRV